MSAAPEPAPARSAREKGALLTLSGLLLVSVVLAVALLSGGEESDEIQVADGMIVDADERAIVFRPDEPIDGQAQIELVVPPDAARELDVPHLVEHATMAEPVRMHYERRGDEYVARAAYDLPGFR